MTVDEYVSTPARRILNQLLVDGKVIGERDEGREKSIMWDICRSFHPNRKGMFTCWEQKINARPGNFGSRIDYVLCSEDWKDWFCESNIQEGLMGSDHCPVYAVLKVKVAIDGMDVNVKDIMSHGIFQDGLRQRDWSAKDLLPLSARLIPEFDRRRNIRDMFNKKPSLPRAETSDATPRRTILPDRNVNTVKENGPGDAYTDDQDALQARSVELAVAVTAKTPQNVSAISPAKPFKRPIEPSLTRSQKRGKSNTGTKINAGRLPLGKGQSSLMGFFKSKTQQSDGQVLPVDDASGDATRLAVKENSSEPTTLEHLSTGTSLALEDSSTRKPFDLTNQKTVVDPIVAKESWSKLLGKRVVPRCEHNDPCISHITRKEGENCGRSFFMCSRPLGPSGKKEKNTEWRCGTFIWSSEWTTDRT